MPSTCAATDPIRTPSIRTGRVPHFVREDEQAVYDLTSEIIHDRKLSTETFERALRGRSTFDASRGTPIAWLFGIAGRCVAEAVEKRVLTVAEPEEQAERADLEEQVVTRMTLGAAIETLDERDRDLIALRYGADLASKRIGEILGMERNAVDVALHRALARLRAQLEEKPAPGKAPAQGSKAVPIEP